ncbi:tetratricopeptide repeat protein [Leptolyngbya sp. AN03gr2]|uniref:tetratricopeptide repeat protein n=1 Tax=unclassified Leptolyngbya TaxID=2650499 RepID=UPI003D320D24
MKPDCKLSAAITLVGVLATVSVVVNIQQNRKADQLQQAQPFILNSTQLIQKGQYAEARSSLEKALEFLPEHATLHNNLGFACQQEKDFTCAETHFRKAVELVPQSWQFHKNLASLYHIQQRYTESQVEYLKTLDIAPDEEKPAIIADFGRLLNQTGNYLEAFNRSQAALMRGQSPEVRSALLNNIAWADWKLGRRKLAEIALRQSIQQQATVDNLCLLSEIQATHTQATSNKTTRQSLKQCQAKVQSELAQNPTLLEFKPEVREWSQSKQSGNQTKFELLSQE